MAGQEAEGSEPPSPRTTRRRNPLQRNASTGELDERTPLLTASRSRIRISEQSSTRQQKGSLSRDHSYIGALSGVILPSLDSS